MSDGSQHSMCSKPFLFDKMDIITTDYLKEKERQCEALSFDVLDELMCEKSRKQPLTVLWNSAEKTMEELMSREITKFGALSSIRALIELSYSSGFLAGSLVGYEKS